MEVAIAVLDEKVNWNGDNDCCSFSNCGWDCSIGLWCCVVVFPTFSRAFTQLSLCIEFLAIAFLVRAGLGWARCSSSSHSVLASARHCWTSSRRLSVTRESRFAMFVSKRRLLKARNEWLICSTPSSSWYTRLRSVSMLLSFRLRYVCCAERNCSRRR